MTSKDLLTFPPYRGQPASPPERFQALIGFLDTHRRLDIAERLAIAKRYGLIDDGKPWPWPPAANDTTLVITEAQLDRALGAVATAMQEEHR